MMSCAFNQLIKLIAMTKYVRRASSQVGLTGSDSEAFFRAG
jgi:hypothetical protein